MSNFIKILMKNKLKQLTAEKLLSYADEYGFTLTAQEAKDISVYLKRNDLDPFNQRDRQLAFNELAKITNVNTAKKAEQLFQEMIQQYGLEHLFDD